VLLFLSKVKSTDNDTLSRRYFCYLDGGELAWQEQPAATLH
jgi:hypothetical protein